MTLTIESGMGQAKSLKFFILPMAHSTGILSEAIHLVGDSFCCTKLMVTNSNWRNIEKNTSLHK